MVIWVGMIAVGNAIGEPSMAVQSVVITGALALNGAWIVLVSVVLDRFVKQRLERSELDSTDSGSA